MKHSGVTNLMQQDGTGHHATATHLHGAACCHHAIATHLHGAACCQHAIATHLHGAACCQHATATHLHGAACCQHADVMSGRQQTGSQQMSKISTKAVIYEVSELNIHY